MEKKKKTALTIPHCILMAAAVVLDCVTLGKFAPVMSFAIKAVIVTSVVAMLAALGYILLGYSKKAAGLYKLYMAMYILVCVFSLIGISKYGNGEVVELILRIAIFAILIILAFWTNNGKTASYILGGVLVLCSVGLILCVVFGVGGYTADQASYLLMELIAEFMLASTAGVMILAKYADKTARGTK